MQISNGRHRLNLVILSVFGLVTVWLVALGVYLGANDWFSRKCEREVAEIMGDAPKDTEVHLNKEELKEFGYGEDEQVTFYWRSLEREKCVSRYEWVGRIGLVAGVVNYVPMKIVEMVVVNLGGY